MESIPENKRNAADCNAVGKGETNGTGNDFQGLLMAFCAILEINGLK